MNLGNIVKQAREKAKLSQEALAQKSEVSRNTIYNLENGDPVKIENLRKICREVLQMDGETWKRTVTLWLKELLGPDFDLYATERHASQTRVHERTEQRALDERFAAKLHRLTREQQKEVLRALERPHILESLRALNDLHDKLSAPPEE